MTKYFLITTIILGLVSGANVSYSEEVPTQENIEPSTEVSPPETTETQPIPPTPDVILAEETSDPIVTPPTAEESEVLPEEVPTENTALVQPQIFVARPEPQKIIERKVTKKILLDKSATHSCEPSLFSINLKNGGSTQINISLLKNSVEGFESLEIGSLPKGIDVKINGTEEYLKQIETNEESVTLSISKQGGAQTGSFNVPIIYTIKNQSRTSSAICQINLVNNV
jgi:hypothetical protein